MSSTITLEPIQVSCHNVSLASEHLFPFPFQHFAPLPMGRTTFVNTLTYHLKIPQRILSPTRILPLMLCRVSWPKPFGRRFFLPPLVMPLGLFRARRPRKTTPPDSPWRVHRFASPFWSPTSDQNQSCSRTRKVLPGTIKAHRPREAQTRRPRKTR